MTSAVEILTSVLNKTLTSVEDWKALMEYAQQQIKPTPEPMTEHEILVDTFKPKVIEFFQRKSKECRKQNKKATRESGS